jgi:hypothetical protein
VQCGDRFDGVITVTYSALSCIRKLEETEVKARLVPHDMGAGPEWICVIAASLGNDAKRETCFGVSFRCSSECDRQTGSRPARDCLSVKESHPQQMRSSPPQGMTQAGDDTGGENNGASHQ